MEEGDIDEPFNHRVYCLATILDPQFGLGWVDVDVNNEESGASLRRFRYELKSNQQVITINVRITNCCCCCFGYYY